MKIAIIGGGPAGLYAAILLREAAAGGRGAMVCMSAIALTTPFGFGVGILRRDARRQFRKSTIRSSYRRITQDFAWLGR